MKRMLLGFIVLMVVCSGLFAWDTEQIALPEPVYKEAVKPVAPIVSLVPGLSPQDFQELVYLWALDSYEPQESITFVPLYTLASAAVGDGQDEVPVTIRNNTYYMESVRLTRLAQETYDYGDYDASSNYAEEAARYALLSDEYVALQLRIRAASDALAAANSRIAWASGQNAEERYPAEYAEAEAAYSEAVANMDNELWEDARDSANRAVLALANVQPLPESAQQQAAQAEDRRASPLPAQYTVRYWTSTRDCLWNIAGWSWVYNDPTKWTILYSANRTRMPEPDNPDLIHPGMILDIPSIQGETRSGMWSADNTYSPLR